MDTKQTVPVYNLGIVDASIRLAIGILLLLPILLKEDSIYHLTDFSALLSIYPILTALIRCDPIYEQFHISTNTNLTIDPAIISQFLETSRIYFRSFPSVVSISQNTTAKNDDGDSHKSAC